MAATLAKFKTEKFKDALRFSASGLPQQNAPLIPITTCKNRLHMPASPKTAFPGTMAATLVLSETAKF